MTLTKSRGPESGSKISTKDMIAEVAEHAGVNYEQAADVVYAFLHYLKYAALATEQKVLLRNFGAFYLTRTKGRVYGAHVNAATYRPDRMKLTLTSTLMEVDRWKNMQSIQRTVASALDAALQPHSMDLAVCARIADLVLSSQNVNATSGESRISLLREWVYATGASPLIPAVTTKLDFDDKSYSLLKFRLCGEEHAAVIFDRVPSAATVSASMPNNHDLAFLPAGWTHSAEITRAMSRQDPRKTLDSERVSAYGQTAEEQCKSFYLAYKMAKYGAIRAKTTKK